MSRHYVGELKEFPEGEGRSVLVNGVSIAVFNLGTDLKAVHDNCPHKNLPLNMAGRDDHGVERGVVDAEKCTIECPWHRLEFDLETGHNPVLNTRIPTYEVGVDEDDRVYVEL